MLTKLLKLPFKLIFLPLIPVLMILNFVFAIVVGMSSIVTNLIGTFFIFGSIAGWLTHAAPSMVWQTVGIGIFFFLAPHIAGWLNEKASGIAGSIFGFLIG